MDDFSDTPIIEIAAIIANHLEQYNIRVVLVGGLAVEFYSENLYLTRQGCHQRPPCRLLPLE